MVSGSIGEYYWSIRQGIKKAAKAYESFITNFGRLIRVGRDSIQMEVVTVRQRSIQFDMAFIGFARQVSYQGLYFHVFKLLGEQVFDEERLHLSRIAILESKPYTYVPHEMLEVNGLQAVFGVGEVFQRNGIGNISGIRKPPPYFETEVWQVFFIYKRSHHQFYIADDYSIQFLRFRLPLLLELRTV